MSTINESLFVDPALLQQAEARCLARLRDAPKDVAALRSLVDVYRKAGRLDDAVSTCDTLLRLSPDDATARHLFTVLAGAPATASPSGTRPSPFVLLRDFLPADAHAALLPFVLGCRDRFVPALIGRHGANDPDIRQTLEFRDDWPGRAAFRSRLLDVLPTIVPRLHLTPFEVEATVPIQVRAYPDGHFYKAHMDAPAGTPRANRVINFVYYFHRMPRQYTGGELLLFDTDLEANTFTRASFTRVIPEDNAVIFFPAPYYHSVLPVHCPSQAFGDGRFAINGHVFRRVPQALGDDTHPGHGGESRGH